MSGTLHPPSKYILQPGRNTELLNRQQEETWKISSQEIIWIPEARRMKLPELEFDHGTKILLLVNVSWLTMVYGVIRFSTSNLKMQGKCRQKRIILANASSCLNKNGKQGHCTGLLWPSASIASLRSPKFTGYTQTSFSGSVGFQVQKSRIKLSNLKYHV